MNVACGQPVSLSGGFWGQRELLDSMLGFSEAGMLPDMSEFGKGKSVLDACEDIWDSVISPQGTTKSRTIIMAGDFAAALFCLSVLYDTPTVTKCT